MTMWFSTAEHFKVTLYSLIMGVGLGILYDFIKMSRMLLGVSKYSRTAKKLSRINLPFIKHTAHTSKDKSRSVYSVVILFIGDIFYALICACVYSLFLFHAIRGQVRWYFLLASAIGFFIYYFTVSKFVLVIIELLFFVIRTVFLYLKELLLLPFRLVVRLMKKIISVIKKVIIQPTLHSAIHSRCKKYTEKRRLNLDSEIRFQEL